MDMMITRYQAGTSREDRAWNELENNSGCRRQIICFERRNDNIFCTVMWPGRKTPIRQC